MADTLPVDSLSIAAGKGQTSDYGLQDVLRRVWGDLFSQARLRSGAWQGEITTCAIVDQWAVATYNDMACHLYTFCATLILF